MTTHLLTSWRQPLLTASFMLGSFFAAPAIAQDATSTADTLRWKQDYDQLKARYFVGKDTTVQMPKTAIGPIAYYNYLTQNAANDHYNLSVISVNAPDKTVQSKYNDIDSTLTKVIDQGASLGQQNALLIKDLNFDKQAWPEFVMAKHILINAPQTKLNTQNPRVTYQTLINQTKSNNKPNYTKAAVLLQLMSGMTHQPKQINAADFTTLQSKAAQLRSRLNPSASPQWSQSIFTRAVDTHHRLIKDHTLSYIAKHKAGLARITPVLSSIPPQVKKVIPDITIKNRTSNNQNQMQESIAGFYELVGNDAFDLLNALQAGKGPMKLVDFYKNNPRYNKKPGQAEARARTVLSKAFLKQYHNAGYADDFRLNEQLAVTTVAHAAYYGTQRPTIPPKPVRQTVFKIKPLPLPPAKTDTLTKFKQDSVILERHAPHGAIGLSTNSLRQEAFGVNNANNDKDGSLLRRNGINARVELNHNFAGTKYVERNDKLFYFPGWVGFQLSAEGEAGKINFDRRDQNYTKADSTPIKRKQNYWSAQSSAGVRFGPLNLGAGILYAKAQTKSLLDALSINYSARLNVFSGIDKKGRVHNIGLSTDVTDANSRWNNRNNLYGRSDMYPARAAARHGIDYSLTAEKLAFNISAGMNDTYVTDHSAFSSEYLKSMTRINGKDNLYVTVGIKRQLGGKEKKTHITRSWTENAQGIKQDVKADTVKTTRNVIALKNSVFHNYHLKNRKPAPVDSAAINKMKADSLQAKPAL